MVVVGVAVAALGGCGLDRAGLQDVTTGDGGPHPGNDAAGDRSGGVGGHGGDGGSGGSILGTGGTVGTGGMVVDGTGGMIVGTGGIIVGTGGIIGTGGVIGTGGMIVGTGGSADGGTDAGSGGVGTDGGGLGGNPGTGGAPGTGGMGPPPLCMPACGPCQRCSASRICELDPASTWDLAAISASVTPVDPGAQGGSTSWDTPSGEIGGPLPDPFVELDFLTNVVVPVGHTAPIVDTLLPNWGALMPATQALLNPPGSPIRASDLMAGGKNWQIVVSDEDTDNSTGPFGEQICPLFGPLTSTDFLSGGFTRINVESCVSISIKLTCHP